MFKAFSTARCQEVHLDDIDFETGDLVAMRGNGFVCTGIQIFTSGPYDHIAVVYKCPISNIAYFWEVGACPKNSGPLITSESSVPSSSHLVFAKLRIPNQKQAWIRKIRYSEDEKGQEFKKNFAVRMRDFISSNLGRLYTPDVILKWNKRIGMSILGLGFMQDDEMARRQWTCSQQTALTLEYTGAIKILAEAEEALPKDFMVNGNDVDQCRFTTSEFVTWDNLVKINY